MKRSTVVVPTALLAGLALAACSSSGSPTTAHRSSVAPVTSCQKESPLVNGVTPAGTDLCLGTTGTFTVTADFKKGTGTVTVTPTQVVKAPDTDLAAVAKQIPKFVSATRNDLYYVRTTVRLTASTTPTAFALDNPVGTGYTLSTGKGFGNQYVGVETGACHADVSFEKGAVGESVNACSLVFVDKGATPSAITFRSDPTDLSSKPVRWSPTA